MVSYAMPGGIPTINRGDRIIKENQTIEQKAQQVAVDKYDITGAHIKIPTYFVVTYPNGETKALHHIKDAREISDVIRLMRFEEEKVESNLVSDNSGNSSGFIVVLALSLFTLLFITLTVAIGIF
jgi:hypothetical protein